MRSLPKLILLASLAALSFGCRASQPSSAAPSAPVSTFAPPDQASAPLLPDAKMTPGATLPVTKDDICVPGYSKKVRNVPASVKRQVYEEYGIRTHKAGDYEVDHLISLQLGGSNSLKNLWPQSYLTQPWNAHVKDALENRMHADVCRGKVDLATVQREIATDWIAAYKKYFRTSLPLTKGGGRRPGRVPHPLTDDDNTDDAVPGDASAATPAPAPNGSPAAGQVWVNLSSGKYFRPGSKYYGHTKRGQFMPEAAAKQQGYIAAQER